MEPISSLPDFFLTKSDKTYCFLFVPLKIICLSYKVFKKMLNQIQITYSNKVSSDFWRRLVKSWEELGQSDGKRKKKIFFYRHQ